MADTSAEVAKLYREVAVTELDSAQAKIEHCLHQLSEEQAWSRPAEELNSVANLLLHLAGNIRQWIISGVGGVPDVRQRQSEFDDRSQRPKQEILDHLRQAVAESKQVISELSDQDLLAMRRVQGFEVSGMQAIFDSVSHFRGHTQEIVHITRSLLRDKYAFDFVPNEEQA